MGSWWSDRRIGRGSRLGLTWLLFAAAAAGAPVRAAAQSISPAERDALVRLRVDRGGRAEEVDALLRSAGDAAATGIPLAPLASKIREGLAKGVHPNRIEVVVRRMAADLGTADRLLREVGPDAAGPGREAAMTLVAEALGAGVTPDEVRELGRQAAGSGNATAPLDVLAGAAKGLSFVKEAELPVNEGTTLMAESVRQGFGLYEILDLGREIKRRGPEYRAGRASLRALREAIARGERPRQLFGDRARAGERVDRDPRTDNADRPRSEPRETPVERPGRTARPDTPQRPERPERPERPRGDRLR